MPNPILSIETIARDAREAAESDLPPTACPYPEEWEAADQWQKAYEARARELRVLAEA